jgi:naphthoate synthase
MTHVSDIFDPTIWREVEGFEALTDLTYHLDIAGRVARVAFSRPEVRNAFRPRSR